MGEPMCDRPLSSTLMSLARCTLHLECFARDLINTEHQTPHLVLWVSSGSVVRCFVVRVLCGREAGVRSVK